MKYQSTRNSEVEVSAAYAIKTGLSSEGGLFVPKSFPKFSLEFIGELSNMTYNDRACAVFEKFLDDFTTEEIRECVDKAYNKEHFETENIAPVYKLSDDVYILELWHGPTCAFKDMALQILPHLLTKSAAKCECGKEIVILVATSGDTGKAALEGFANVEGTRIFVFYPQNGVSEIQKLQMITQEGDNVSVCAVKGNFDDAQTGVKKIFTDKDYAQKLSQNGFELSSANSINWGRLMPQIVYYFSSYADLVKNDEIKLGEKVNFTVPTGNFGDILAGYYAMKMGLPVNKFICASNENNVLTDFIKSGTYDKNRKFYQTTSPSMDILVSSNLERLLFDMYQNTNDVAELMNKLATDGVYTVSEQIKQKIDTYFWAGFANDTETAQAIKDTDRDFSYVMDTHTAVGKKVYDKYKKETGDNTKSIILSTASPFKFNQSVLIALEGEDIVLGKDEFELLELLSNRSDMKIPNSLASLKNKTRLFNTECEKEQMKNVVSEFLNIG